MIAERKKDVLPGVLVTLVLALVGAAALYILWPQLQPKAMLRIGDGVFSARVATTEVERTQGLSGTTQLRADQAMIFVFDSDNKWSMWMKDMDYPIDIVWTDSNKKIVYIVKNAPADSYPEKFTPNKDARYVIELPAGTVDGKSIKVNSGVVFDETHLGGFQL